MPTLAGRHALITGGGSGIGTAIAAELARAGAHVTIAGRRRAVLEEAAARIPGCAVAETDITSDVSCAAMIETAHRTHGPLDIMIANAGAAESVPATRADPAHWQRMIDTNLTGSFLTARAALPDLLRPKAATSDVRRLVFVASTAALKGYPYVAAYCAAKHGVLGLMRALAAELGTRGLTVNAVCPGFTETPLLADAISNIMTKTGRTEAAAKADLARANPQGRLVTPPEVASAVRWICEPVSESIHGQAISISGGEI